MATEQKQTKKEIQIKSTMKTSGSDQNTKQNNKELIERIDRYLTKGSWLTPAMLLDDCKKALQDAEAEIEALKMENMTHEYNEAERERFQPEYDRQIKEPLKQEINRLKAELEAKEHSIVKRARERDDYRLLSERQLKTIQELKAKLSEQVDPIELIKYTRNLIYKFKCTDDHAKQILEQFKKETE
jgi:hypothetical protein